MYLTSLPGLNILTSFSAIFFKVYIIQMIVSSVSNLYAFYLLFSCLLALTEIARTMLYRDSENRHLIITNLEEIVFTFPLLIMILGIGFLCLPSLGFKLSALYFLSTFIMNRCWILSDTFFCIHRDNCIMFLLQFINMVNHIDFQILHLFCMPRINF